MDWILANIKLVIIAIVLVVYAFKAMRAKGEAQDEAGESTRRTLPGEHDEAEAQRTREIQEEIRRRILARQRGEGMPAPSPEPEMAREEPMPTAIPLPPPPVPSQPPTARRVEPYEDPYAAEEAARAAQQAAMLEAQRAMEEQLRQARRIREMAAAGVPSIASSQVSGSSDRRSVAARRGLRADLAGRGSLRRAMVLREILGEPVALRRGPAGSSPR